MPDSRVASLCNGTIFPALLPFAWVLTSTALPDQWPQPPSPDFSLEAFPCPPSPCPYHLQGTAISHPGTVQSPLLPALPSLDKHPQSHPWVASWPGSSRGFQQSKHSQAWRDGLLGMSFFRALSSKDFTILCNKVWFESMMWGKRSKLGHLLRTKIHWCCICTCISIKMNFTYC